MVNAPIVVKQVKKFPYYDIFIENPYAGTGQEGWQNWTRVMYVKGTVTYLAGAKLSIKTLYNIIYLFLHK